MWHPLSQYAENGLQCRAITVPQMTVIKTLTHTHLNDLVEFLAAKGLSVGSGVSSLSVIGKWIEGAPTPTQNNKHAFRAKTGNSVAMTNWLTALFSSALYDFMLLHRHVFIDVNTRKCEVEFTQLVNSPRRTNVDTKRCEVDFTQ